MSSTTNSSTSPLFVVCGCRLDLDATKTTISTRTCSRQWLQRLQSLTGRPRRATIAPRPSTYTYVAHSPCYSSCTVYVTVGCPPRLSVPQIGSSSGARLVCCWAPARAADNNDDNNNNNYENVYGAMIVTEIIARVHPVHLINADWAPGGCQPSDHANWLGLWVCRKLAATIHIRHHHCYYYSARKMILILPPTRGGRLSWPWHCSKVRSPCPKLYPPRNCCRSIAARARTADNATLRAEALRRSTQTSFRLFYPRDATLAPF